MRKFIMSLLAITGVLLGGAPVAVSAPADSGSASGSFGPARSAADRQFLRQSYYDDESWSVQDAAIGLAHSQCRWLDAHGSSAANRIRLAESSRDTVEYPYLFLNAAIDAYCPWNG